MFASGHSPLGLAHLLLYPEGAHIMNTRWQSSRRREDWSGDAQVFKRAPRDVKANRPGR